MRTKEDGASIKRRYSRLMKKAQENPDVAEMTRVYQELQAAQLETEKYLRMAAPITLQTNCTDSYHHA